MTKSKTENIKSERIFVRLFPNEKAELEAKAKAENLTISEYVRRLQTKNGTKCSFQCVINLFSMS